MIPSPHLTIPMERELENSRYGRRVSGRILALNATGTSIDRSWIELSVLSRRRIDITLSSVDRKQTLIRDVLGLRHDWTPIAVQLDNSKHAKSKLIELAEARRWRLIDLQKYEKHVPPKLMVRGALVDTLPMEPTSVELRQRGIPCVRLGRLPHPDDPIMPAVMPDQWAIGHLAAEHFAERDFKHVAFIGRDPWGENQTIFEGLAARSKELAITCHIKQLSKKKMIQMAAQQRWQAEQAVIKSWLAKLPRPVGLLCFGDNTAVRYCEWALDTGLRIPEDLAVLGIGNNSFACGSATVPLSSVAFDEVGLQKTAMTMLEDLMAGRTLEKTTVKIEPLFVVTRQSTDVLAVSNPLVARTLRFMWDHVTENLSVDQIANLIGVPRRNLERAFKQDLGRGINKEFQRRRMEKARDLLLQSDLRIIDIAQALNFTSAIYFNQAFRAAYGISPSAYRQQNCLTDPS